MRAITWWGAAALVVACGSGGSDGGTSSSGGGSSSGASSSGASSSGASSSGASSGGSSSGDECADCGQCGIAGPKEVGMSAEDIGVDAMGRAAVGLDNVPNGECQGAAPKRPSTLHVALDNSAIEVSAGAEAIDTTKAAIDQNIPGIGYKWNDRDLTVKVVPGSNGTLDLVFSSAGATLFSVKCLPTGELGSCTKE